MNWKQLYTSSTEQERLEALIHMLQVIEARQNKIIFISEPTPLSKSHVDLGRGRGWGFIRNRRRTNQYHFITERRGRHTILRAASVVSILASLLCVMFGSAIILIHLPPHLLFFPITSLIAVLLFKPRHRFPLPNAQLPIPDSRFPHL